MYSRNFLFNGRVHPSSFQVLRIVGINVVSAETVNTFKNRLDKFWLDQEVLYDYKTDLRGIGNRSIV